ncbi:MAG: hypothetical protein IIZ75_11835 [Lachnospiraceae bacterium]|nr:hypothetical protein [Lachnospiraceae bacterium]
MIDVVKAAEEAQMIVAGYAYKRKGDWIEVINLNNPIKVVVLSRNNKVIETTMDDIEIEIVKDYLIRNIEFMEPLDAEVL